VLLHKRRFFLLIGNGMCHKQGSRSGAQAYCPQEVERIACISRIADLDSATTARP